MPLWQGSSEWRTQGSARSASSLLARCKLRDPAAKRDVQSRDLACNRFSFRMSPTSCQTSIALGPWLSGNQGDCLLLRVSRIYLENLYVRRARTNRLDHESKQRSRSIDPGRVWLPGRRNHGLSSLRVDALHDGDLLRASGEKPAVPNLLNLDHGRIEVNQQRNRVQVLDVRHL